MAGFRHYTDELPGFERLGFTVFMLRDCDDSVMGDLEVVEWASAQGTPIHVDDHFWNHPEVHSRHGNDYAHTAIVDGFDSAVLMIRDPDIAMAFKLKFC